MKTLYKKDSKGKIRIWNISTLDDKLVQESGILDGKLVIHSKICTPKNIGKSNETTGSEQALLELESEYKAKLTEGYFKTKEQAENEEVILPMLAKSYEDEKHKIDWTSDVFIQPKLDGMRCLAIIKNGLPILKSRDGKLIENMKHIIDELTGLEDQILDGELYAHGLSFQENMKLIKKYRPNETEKIKYHVYDFVSDDVFPIRFNKLKTLLDSNDFKYIEGTDTIKVLEEKYISQSHSEFISEGYEGSIIRHGNKPYGIDKRCDSLLKYKEFKDMDLEIFQITPNEANPKHGTPHFNLKGKSFKAGVKMSHEDREDLLTNKDKYIGKIANIRYFELTDEGIPRFPVMIGIHEDR